jgi:ABC-type antimicrobial peptide transport system permease subunit
MSLQSEIVSENQIINMLQENNPLVWKKVYDKYATAMYGMIFTFTEDKLLAEEIFMNAFIDLKQKQILSKIECALCPIILRYTYSCTIIHLKKNGILPKNLNSSKEAQLIYLLITKCNSLKEAASLLSITVDEAKKRLQFEFKNLRTLKIISANPQSRRDL